MVKRSYTKPGRLADVLALTQVLALDEYTHRGIPGLERELQGKPVSSESWIELAKEHQEFFRVSLSEKGEHNVSLVARHVLPHEPGEHRPLLSSDFTAALLHTAITLHDRQVQAKEWWKSLMPLWAALIAGPVATASTLLTLWFKGCPR